MSDFDQIAPGNPLYPPSDRLVRRAALELTDFDRIARLILPPDFLPLYELTRDNAREARKDIKP
jgi:hypothetical protein